MSEEDQTMDEHNEECDFFRLALLLSRLGRRRNEKVTVKVCAQHYEHLLEHHDLKEIVDQKMRKALLWTGQL